MGAWGAKAFDNDAANDWAYGLDDVDNLSLVVSALARIREDDDYVDSDAASEALAACEVLARLQGNSGYHNAYTEKVDAWVAAHLIKPPPSMLKLANEAIDRILGANSELCELWNEGEGGEWYEAVKDLRRRLGA